MVHHHHGCSWASSRLFLRAPKNIGFWYHKNMYDRPDYPKNKRFDLGDKITAVFPYSCAALVDGAHSRRGRRRETADSVRMVYHHHGCSWASSWLFLRAPKNIDFWYHKNMYDRPDYPKNKWFNPGNIITSLLTYSCAALADGARSRRGRGRETADPVRMDAVHRHRGRSWGLGDWFAKAICPKRSSCCSRVPRLSRTGLSRRKRSQFHSTSGATGASTASEN